MYLKELSPGKTVNIYVTRDGYKYRVVSKIEDVNDDHVFVTLIAKNKRVFRFLDSDQVDIIYKHGQSLYLWENVKAGVTELDDDQVHYFMSQKKGTIYNRRNAYRVEYGTSLILHYSVLNEDMMEFKLDEFDDLSILQNYMDLDLFDEKICEGYMKDLSETGIGIYANEEFKVGDEIAFDLSTDFGDMHCKVKVIRITKAYHNVYRYCYGCEFIQSSRELPKHIFNLQRKIIHKVRKDS
ncbi:flagellar brake protein [Anaeromicropila herbilytica]|uniref:PilZ domain-containing protein n=1 Tax=Anaeromicropila herbilytica TaxID=2785025 RepID=A0A7R7EN07_9FIRM|nr:PilZ domain-containing protein [Anaeromicropila herbilytica]BCN31565.1 hypothetical protein bsdtb5_28600 [Anaeromicropila herbilytica]